MLEPHTMSAAGPAGTTHTCQGCRKPL